MHKFKFKFDEKQIDHVYWALISYRSIANKNSRESISDLLMDIEDKIYRKTVDKITGDSDVSKILTRRGEIEENV